MVGTKIPNLETGVLKRAVYPLMSGAVATTATDVGWYTGPFKGVEVAQLPDEGILLISAKYGSIIGKLPATPMPGAILDIVFCDSGSGTGIDGAKTFTLSGNIINRKLDTAQILAQLVFEYPGQSVTLVGTQNPSYWWLVPNASGSINSPGQIKR